MTGALTPHAAGRKGKKNDAAREHPKVRRKPLRNISEIRRFFFRNTDPIFFISATNFNLLGIDEWVGHFHYINYIDCFDGRHPNVFIPPEMPHKPFESIEDINNYLLSHPDVKRYIMEQCRRSTTNGGSGCGKAVFLMFNEETEKLAKKAGLAVCFPSAELRAFVDDKINTTRIAESAGVPCVPNILAKVDSYQALRAVSHKLGRHLVVQTAFGDSGHTTYFISGEQDWKKYADEIIEAPEVKIMKRIRCRGAALEACVTRHGTSVGPLMTELVGFKELTPYRGGWCGNEVFAEAFSLKLRKQAREYAFKFGQAIRQLGYRGYFEIDFLIDEDSGQCYLGEVNPRITGASSMTNLAAFAHADAPLFLFHLLEWMETPFQLDVEDINDRWADASNIDPWSQLVIKHCEDSIDLVTSAPPSGIWEMDRKTGAVRYLHMQTHRRTVQDEHHAFFLRITGTGDYRYEGADLGILISRGRFMNEKHKLTPRAKKWIKGIRSHYTGQPIPRAQENKAEEIIEVGGFKLS